MIEESQAVCYRCGYTWMVNPKKHRGRMLCSSCRAKPVTTIQYGKTRCISWHGNYAADGVTPVVDGVPFMPGERICGHSDCVAVGHQVNRLSADVGKLKNKKKG